MDWKFAFLLKLKLRIKMRKRQNSQEKLNTNLRGIPFHCLIDFTFQNELQCDIQGHPGIKHELHGSCISITKIRHINIILSHLQHSTPIGRWLIYTSVHSETKSASYLCGSQPYLFIDQVHIVKHTITIIYELAHIVKLPRITKTGSGIRKSCIRIRIRCTTQHFPLVNKYSTCEIVCLLHNK